MRYRNHPKHRDVKALRRLQKDVFFKHIPLDKVDASMPLQDITRLLAHSVSQLFAHNKEAFAAFTNDMEELVYVGTIMLATGLTPEAIEQMDEDEFWDTYEKSKEALGGTCEDFLARYTAATIPPQVGEAPPSGTSLQRRERSG
ncbi:MAG: hypothetical protein ACXQT3_06105 [Methermicoccaceae archaeon]